MKGKGQPATTISSTHWGACTECGPDWDDGCIRVSPGPGCGKDYCHRCQDVHDWDAMGDECQTCEGNGCPACDGTRKNSYALAE